MKVGSRDLSWDGHGLDAGPDHFVVVASGAAVGAHVPWPTTNHGVATWPTPNHGVATCRLEEVLMLSYTLLAVGSISVSAARWKEGRDNLVQAEQIVVQFKDAQLWENVVSQRAHLEFYHGNFAQSKELYEQAHASAAARGDPKIQNRCMMGIAGILIAQNQVVVVVVVVVVVTEPLHDGHCGDPDRAEPGRCCCCCCGGGGDGGGG